MDRDEWRRSLRDEMKEILQGTRLGLVVVPRSERHRLGNHILDGLLKIVRANQLSVGTHHVYLDEGIEFEGVDDAITRFRFAMESEVYTQQRSCEVRGLQLPGPPVNAFPSLSIEVRVLESQQARPVYPT